MSTVFILLSTLLMLTFVALWGFLAMAGWSDRQLALAGQEWRELKVDSGRDGTEPRQ